MSEDYQRLIYVGISRAFHNKDLRPGFTEAAWGNSFIPCSLQLAKLVDHILAGGSWTPGYFHGNSRRNDTFRFSVLIALDLDEGTSVAEALAHPFIAAHAFLVHPTASSSPAKYKTRVVFRLDTPIEHAEAWRALVAVLIRELGLKIDPASQKPAQPYHGSTNRVEQPYINLDAMLPIGNITPMLIELAWEEMERDLAPKPERVALTGGRAEAYARSAFDDELIKLANAAPGSRNDALYHVAKTLYSMAAGNWPGIDNATVTDALEHRAAIWDGGHVSRHSLSTIASGRKSAKARALLLPVGNTYSRMAVAAGLQTIDCKPQPVIVERVDPVFELKTVRQYGLLMTVCREGALIALHVQAAGIADDFTVADLAQSASVSNATAQRWLDKALSYMVISERFANFMTIDKADSIVMKNEKRHGAAVARRYCLTPDEAYPVICKRLADHVQELMEKGDPDVILRDEAVEAGIVEDYAERLEHVTEATAQSIDAFEVSAKHERAALRQANELIRLAEIDTTPFTPDILPCSPAELSAALIAALIATDPERVWRQWELMWVAGVKKGSVAGLIRKTDLVPAAMPTFINVPIEGKDLHRAVRARMKEYHGAPVAWIDGDGEVICTYSHVVPSSAKAVRLNIGKKYLKRVEATEIEQPTPETPVQAEKEDQPVSEVEQAERAQKRARARLKPALRGCMEARGWRLMPGAYGYWYRENKESGETREFDNTFDGMVAALLLDYEWAVEQREIRRLQEVEF